MGLIVVIVDLSTDLITEELNFVGKRAKEEGNIVSPWLAVACLRDGVTSSWVVE